MVKIYSNRNTHSLLREMENGITILEDILAISYKAKWLTLFGWGVGGAPNSLQMVIAAMNLKDAFSLEEKL